MFRKILSSVTLCLCMLAGAAMLSLLAASPIHAQQRVASSIANTKTHVSASDDPGSDGNGSVEDKGNKTPNNLSITFPDNYPLKVDDTGVNVTVCVYDLNNQKKSTKRQEIFFSVAGGLSGNLYIGAEKNDLHKPEDQDHCALIGISFPADGQSQQITITATIWDTQISAKKTFTIPARQSDVPSSDVIGLVEPEDINPSVASDLYASVTTEQQQINPDDAEQQQINLDTPVS